MRLLNELMNRMRLTSPVWKELERARKRPLPDGVLPAPHPDLIVRNLREPNK